MMRRDVERWAWMLLGTWRRTCGQAFPWRGAPGWLVDDLATTAGDEQEMRMGHGRLMAHVREEVGST
jgi:hypothetical protein